MRGHQEAEGNSSPSDIPSPTSAVSCYNDVSEWATSSARGPGADSPALDCLTPARHRGERRIDKFFALVSFTATRQVLWALKMQPRWSQYSLI